MRIVPVVLVAVSFITSQASACTFPKEYDVQRIDFGLERIDASLKVAIEFPKLSAMSCEEDKVTFGTLWTFDIPQTAPVKLKSVDRNGVVVQERGLSGQFQLKVTATWAAIYFFDAVWDKRLSDHGLTKIELWSTSTLIPAPAIYVEDAGQARILPATFVTY